MELSKEDIVIAFQRQFPSLNFSNIQPYINNLQCNSGEASLIDFFASKQIFFGYIVFNYTPFNAPDNPQLTLNLNCDNGQTVLFLTNLNSSEHSPNIITTTQILQNPIYADFFQLDSTSTGSSQLILTGYLLQYS